MYYIDHAIRIFYHCHRLILKRLGCQPSCQKMRYSPACAGQPLSLCNFRIIVSLLTLYVTGFQFFHLLTGTLTGMVRSRCPPRLIRKALGQYFKLLQQPYRVVQALLLCNLINQTIHWLTQGDQQSFERQVPRF